MPSNSPPSRIEGEGGVGCRGKRIEDRVDAVVQWLEGGRRRKLQRARGEGRGRVRGETVTVARRGEELSLRCRGKCRGGE